MDTCTTQQFKEAVSIARKIVSKYGNPVDDGSPVRVASQRITVQTPDALASIEFGAEIAGHDLEPRPVALDSLKALAAEWSAKDTPTIDSASPETWSAAGIEFPNVEPSDADAGPLPKFGAAEWIGAYDCADLAAVADSASRDDMRPVLCGIHFAQDGITATDSYRLAHVATDTGPQEGITVPADMVKILTDVCQDRAGLSYADGPPRVAQFMAETKRGNALTVQIRTIDGQFPDYRRLFPEVWDVSAPADPDAAAAVAAKVRRWNGQNRPAIVEFGADAITYAYQGAPGKPSVKPHTITNGTPPEFRTYTTKEGGSKTAEPFRAGVNPDYWEAGLKFAPEPTISGISPLRPMMMQQDRRRYLVMPIRLND